MRYRRLGRSGLQVSELSLGSWVTYGNQVDESAAIEALATAKEAGVNFFDNAEVYAGGKSEVLMGNALKHLGWERESFIISTKFYWGIADGPNRKNTLTTWSPLASGVLTGKYADGIPAGSRSTLPGYQWLEKTVTNPEWIAATERLRPIRAELGCTLSQLAIAWCATNPHVSTVITGASRTAQVAENMKALEIIPQLNADLLQRIEEAVGKILLE